MNDHLKTLAEMDKIKAETDKIKAETAKAMTAALFEAIKVSGIVISLILALWANCTKADDSKVKATTEKTDIAIGAINENVEAQHEQSEKLRETMEGTTEAVKAVANTAVDSRPSIPISDGPVDNGCWTVHGGIVKCKVGSATSASASATPPIRVEVPSPPPPAPPLKKVDGWLQ
jgi:hypothetical protein